jgi:hypothetical protein
LTPAQAGGADWSPTRFEQWKGAKEFDYQLEALLNLLCHIEIGHGKTFRHLRYKIGWIPPNSKLQVTYDEEWEGVGSARVTGEVTILEKSATTDNPALVASLDGQNTVKIQVLGTGKQGGLPARSPNNVSNDNPTSGLKRAATAGSLAVKFEGLSPVKIPHKGPKKEEFYDSWL